MSKLYNELAKEYHEMYQSIFDYQKEFELYDKLLKDFNCNKVLEVGCGSGNLSKYFVEAGYDYIGTDLSESMLKIARENDPKSQFLQRDMRELGFENEFDAVLITGRSFTYMTTNDDIKKALESVNRTLKPNGIFIFDNFNAPEIFTNFKSQMEQVSVYNGRTYRRVSNNSFNLETGWTWNWNAEYFIEENGRVIDIIKDNSILRAFTEDELRLFLRLYRFKIISVINEGLAFTIIAEKE